MRSAYFYWHRTASGRISCGCSFGFEPKLATAQDPCGAVQVHKLEGGTASPFMSGTDSDPNPLFAELATIYPLQPKVPNDGQA